jgi:hypothetical protein
VRSNSIRSAFHRLNGRVEKRQRHSASSKSPIRRLVAVLALVGSAVILGFPDPASAVTGQSSLCDNNHMCLSKYVLAQSAGTGMVGYKYNTCCPSGYLAWTTNFDTFVGGGYVLSAQSGRNRDAYQQRRMCLYNYIADNGYINSVSVGYSYSGWFSIGLQTNKVTANYSTSCPWYG